MVATIAVSSRVISTNVGGNTTYAQNLYARLPRLGYQIEYLRGAGYPFQRLGAQYLLSETLWGAGVGTGAASLIHFPADTGPTVHGPIPVVTTIHGIASAHVPAVRSLSAERLWRLRVWRASRVSDAVITVSRSSAQDLQSVLGIPAARIHVIPHGINHDHFHTDGSGDDVSLHPYNLPDSFILYLGNLDPRKNVPSLLTAFTQISDNFPETSLVIAGRHAWGQADLVQQLRGSGDRVRYLDMVPRAVVPALMRRSAVFAFPSLYEGFGFPVLEAMACGAPVVTSDRGSLAEISGGAALVIDPTSPDSIAKALSDILASDQLSTSLSRAGVKHAANYTWERSAASHHELFSELTA